MSAYHERQYEMKRKQKIAEKRVRQTTEEYYARYQTIMNDLKAEGLDELIADEYTRLENRLTDLNNLLSDDPFAARDISRDIGQAIHALPKTARKIRRTMRENEQHQEKEQEKIEINQKHQQKTALQQTWQAEMHQWQDKLSRNLALSELSQLQKRLFSDNSELTQDEFKQQIIQIKQQAEQKAIAYRKEIDSQSQQESNADIVEQLQKDINNSSLSEQKSQNLSEQLKSISIGNKTDEEVKDILLTASKETDQALQDESIRKEVVKAVYKSLKEAGFIVQKPKHSKEGISDEVIIAASRPAGNRALFQINLEGKLQYKFDNYKGQTCQKDMQAVLPKLTEIYGVDLSDAHVIWSNPDDNDAEMKPIPAQQSQAK